MDAKVVLLSVCFAGAANVPAQMITDKPLTIVSQLLDAGEKVTYNITEL